MVVLQRNTLNKPNVYDRCQNPLRTSPGLASFGVTSNSGFEVSSIRNLNKNKIPSKQYNPNKTVFENARVQNNMKLLMQNPWLA